MGSKTFDGVRFQGFTDDHIPPHLHGFYAEVEVLVELLDGKAYLASRDDAVRPLNGKRSDVAYVFEDGCKIRGRAFGNLECGAWLSGQWR